MGVWENIQFLSLSPFSFLSDAAELCFLSGGWRLILLGWALRSEGRWARLWGLGWSQSQSTLPTHRLFYHKESFEFTFFPSRVCCGLFQGLVTSFLLVCF